MSEKLQIGIYKIKKSLVELRKGKTPKKVIANVPYLRSRFKSKGFKIQSIQSGLSKEFNIFLFFKRNKSEIRWKEFIGKIALSNEKILKFSSTKNESYILLLESISTQIIYATTGGFGHTAIQGAIESDFGLEILSRLVKAEDKTLRSTKEKNLIGGVLGEVKFFRNNYNLNENESFGSFYQELHSSLNKKLLIKIFGFDTTEVDSDSLCVAKNSFTIKKSISFDQLLTIVKNCENLINTTSPIVEINGVIKLNKADQVLIAELENELDETLFNNYIGDSTDISIELCHKDFDKYLHADNFTFVYTHADSEKNINSDESITNISQVIKEVIKSTSNLSKKQLLSLISKSHIVTTNNDGMIQTADLLRNHFYTEVVYKEKSYFLSDREWFEIKSTFTKKLNEQCQDFINTNTSKLKLQVWNYPSESENDYNSKHISKISFLVFDKFTPENIEVCDILYWDASNIYFVHVKSGFNNSMRDLSHQIYISARRVKEDIKTGYKFIGKLYDKVEKSEGKTPYTQKAKMHLKGIAKDKFLNLFKNRKPVFVLAVLDTAKSKRSFKKIDKFNSNIAKFSLHELVKNMRRLAMDFEIIEIEK